MANIMQCIIGKEFGNVNWFVSMQSPFAPDGFGWESTETENPFPCKNFSRKEVAMLRDFLTKILEEHERIVNDLEQMNADETT